MHGPATIAYAAAVLALFLKTVVVISVQGLTRMRTRTFRHAEDAKHWGGTAVDREDDLVARAQHAHRNDGETQPFFLVFGALYLAAGATPWAACVYFPAYALARVVHTAFLLKPRQPLRNRAFGVGLVITLAVGVHAVVAVFRGAVG